MESEVLVKHNYLLLYQCATFLLRTTTLSFTENIISKTIQLFESYILMLGTFHFLTLDNSKVVSIQSFKKCPKHTVNSGCAKLSLTFVHISVTLQSTILDIFVVLAFFQFFQSKLCYDSSYYAQYRCKCLHNMALHNGLLLYCILET